MNSSPKNGLYSTKATKTSLLEHRNVDMVDDFRSKSLKERSLIFLKINENYPDRIPVLLYAHSKAKIPQCQNEK